MFITQVLKDLFKTPATGEIPAAAITTDTTPMCSVLNVGGGNKGIRIPEHFKDWQHLLLDIAPGGDVDLVMDARKLANISEGQFDAIYCSHNLEHYYKHDVAVVLAGFFHVLKPQGFAEIHVPNMRSVLKHFAETDMDIDDVLYESPMGPISVHDVIYGLGKQIESSGVDFYAHKTGFTETTLMSALKRAGFPMIWIGESTDKFSLSALAFKQAPTPAQSSLLGLGLA